MLSFRPSFALHHVGSADRKEDPLRSRRTLGHYHRIVTVIPPLLARTTSCSKRRQETTTLSLTEIRNKESMRSLRRMWRNFAIFALVLTCFIFPYSKNWYFLPYSFWNRMFVWYIERLVSRNRNGNFFPFPGALARLSVLDIFLPAGNCR